MYFFKFNIGFIIQYVLAILWHFYQKKKKEKIQTFSFIDYLYKKILTFLPISTYSKWTINILSEQVLYRIHFEKN